MVDPSRPPRVARLDPVALVEAVNRVTGAGARLLGAAAAGEVGAGFVEWPDGRRGVITRSGARAEELHRTRSVLAHAAEAGLPVPQYLEIVELGDERAILQQCLTGSSPNTITLDFVDQLLEVTDRCTGLATGTLAGNLSPVELYLTSSGPGFCEHRTLELQDETTRSLLARIHDIGRRSVGPEDGADLVHLDFHPGNVLVNQGRLSGLVDWDGVGRGDRRFALVTLLFDLAHGHRFRPGYLEPGHEDEIVGRVLERLTEAPQDALSRWWAHMSLRLVDWTIRHDHPSADIAHYLAFSTRGLDALEAGDALSTDTVLR